MGYYYTKKEAEKAILVGVALQDEGISYDQMSEYLDELAFLAETAGAQTVKIFTQNLDKPVHSTFIGKGKLEEIRQYIEENETDMVIFDDELSPTQLRNIENELKGVKVLDRTNLILDIFASRARTAHAKTQVELAQYQYLLPRLTGMWTHLERQKGGIGLRGPGETEIETDRRVIRDKITRLKEQLEKIDKQKSHPTQKPGETGACCLGRIHQCRKVHPNEPVEQIGSICRKQTVCHPGHYRPENRYPECSFPAGRHRGVYPETTDTPYRIVQIHPGRSERSGCYPPCSGHLPPSI